MTKRPRIPDQDILNAYLRLGNVWRVAGELGLSGQAVHERLRRLGIVMKNQPMTPMEEQRLREIYAKGFKREDGVLKALAQELGRSESWLCRKAAELGLKQPKAGSRFAPKGAGTWKAGWREIGGQRIFFRSRWEANFARYLETLKTAKAITRWEHEPDTFWFENIRRGVRSYLPDFKVTYPDGRIEYFEVKGYMDGPSLTKLKRMALYYPDVTVKVVREKQYRHLERTHGKEIGDWE